MDKYPEVDTSDDLVIVNRSRSYCVSKKLICSSIPYFEKMFCCDLLESRENKVTLDLDEDAFESILNAILGDSYVLSMEKVLQMSQVADYLMIDKFEDEFLKFLRQNFTIEHLPLVLNSITEFSKLINLRMVNGFIGQHFLKIINTKVFLDYPVETVEHITRLNLNIDSEYQVIRAIEKWVIKDFSSRGAHIFRLFRCIRWYHWKREEIDQSKKSKHRKRFYQMTSCLFDSGKMDNIRVKLKSLIVICKIDEKNINLLLLDEAYSILACGHFELDISLNLYLITDPWTVDIIYDSGRKGIRADWKQRKFCHLDMIGSDHSYYGQLYNFFIHFGINKGFVELYLDEDVKKVPGPEATSAFLEFDGQFHVCGYTEKKKPYVLSPVQDRSWFYGTFNDRYIHACLYENIIFVINEEGDHRLCDMKTRSSSDIKLLEDQKFKFDNLQLTCFDKNFHLLDKSTKTIYTFDWNSRIWKKIGQISSPHDLITLTTVYLPDKQNKTLLKVL